MTHPEEGSSSRPLPVMDLPEVVVMFLKATEERDAHQEPIGGREYVDTPVVLYQRGENVNFSFSFGARMPADVCSEG